MIFDKGADGARIVIGAEVGPYNSSTVKLVLQ